MTADSKVKKFHQFVQVDSGPVNAAIVDLLKGNVYQVPREIIEKFAAQKHQDIGEFLQSAEQEELLMAIDRGDWIPEIPPLPEKNELIDTTFEIHVEAGVNLEAVLAEVAQLKGFKLQKILYYGELPPDLPTGKHMPPILQRTKTFQECLDNNCIDENFNKIAESFYTFTHKYNSCWGLNIAFTADGKIRPCIFSEIILGDWQHDSLASLMERIQELWVINKEKVQTCKDCELRYVCFDCREIARRHSGDLYAANPNCKYNPYKGTWAESE